MQLLKVLTFLAVCVILLGNVRFCKVIHIYSELSLSRTPLRPALPVRF